MLYGFGFEYPWALLLIVLLPLFRYIEKYFSVQKRVKGAKFSRIELLEQAMSQAVDYKKKAFTALFILAVITGVLATARPFISMEIPVSPVKLMLVFDTSISMEATDMEPNRLKAARDTAVEFIKRAPDSIKIGLEYFYGSSYVAISPTEQHEKVINSLNKLDINNLYPGTAIGSAIDAAVNTLSINKKDKSRLVIILLTDGESNQGIMPLSAAKIAGSEKIKIFTIGIGSHEGAFVRGGYLAALDEGTLMEIANITGGKYFRAASKNDFKKIYNELRTKAFLLEKQKIEITALLSGISLMLFLFVIYFGVSVFKPIF